MQATFTFNLPFADILLGKYIYAIDYENDEGKHVAYAFDKQQPQSAPLGRLELLPESDSGAVIRNGYICDAFIGIAQTKILTIDEETHQRREFSVPGMAAAETVLDHSRVVFFRQNSLYLYNDEVQQEILLAPLATDRFPLIVDVEGEPIFITYDDENGFLAGHRFNHRNVAQITGIEPPFCVLNVHDFGLTNPRDYQIDKYGKDRINPLVSLRGLKGDHPYFSFLVTRDWIVPRESFPYDEYSKRMLTPCFLIYNRDKDIIIQHLEAGLELNLGPLCQHLSSTVTYRGNEVVIFNDNSIWYFT